MDIKELEGILKLCRKQGVTDLEMDGLKFKLGDLPAPKSKSEPIEETDVEDQFSGMTPDILAPNQINHLAKGGSPSDLPKPDWAYVVGA